MTPAEVRDALLGAAALGSSLGRGADGVRTLFERVGCVQLDPIDRIGTNADLVAFARVDGLRRGDVHRHAAGYTFEHFAKERCLLHARFFAHYRDRAVETPWWRHSERMKRLPTTLVDDVRAEILERGPIPAQALADRGRAEAMDWAGWKSTSSASALAAEVLWTRCEVIVSGRDARGRRLYDHPQRLGEWADARPTGDFGEAMLLERVRTAGLLARAGGAHWSMLADTRTDGTVERLLEAGKLREVRVGRRPYLSLPEPTPARPDDGRARILGPLDALLWDRALVREVFGFDYVWEIYKPAEQRTWGYYVCPILEGGALVGRLEAHREGKNLVIDRVWGGADGLRAALEQLAEANGCDSMVGERTG